MILGISCYFHDSAVALVDEKGVVKYAMHEERFSRLKHDNRFPELCIAELASLGCTEVDYVIYFEKPFNKFDRNVNLITRNWPRSFVAAKKTFVNLRPQLELESTIRNTLNKYRIKLNHGVHFSEHHLSHAASAFFDSPFASATAISLDGVGELETGSIFEFKHTDQGVEITKKFSLLYPNSVGLLYSAFTEYLGFKVNSGEYKLMGLAPYGRPVHVSRILDNLISCDSDWSKFSLNMEFFDFEGGERSTNSRFHSLFGFAPRRAEDSLLHKHADIAASIQAVTEDLVLSFASFARKIASPDSLVYAGGVALNCVANTVLERRSPFKRIFVQPAAGDAGGALGAAYLGCHLSPARTIRAQAPKSFSPVERARYSAFPTRGRDYSDGEIEDTLCKYGLKAIKLDEESLISYLVRVVAENRTLGLFRGRSEFGPRALGNRSIIANATVPGNISRLNNLIKYRESFRPFAPIILRSEFEKYFETTNKYTNKDSMLFVAYLKSNYRGAAIVSSSEGNALLKPLETGSMFPAVVHLDFSARVQVVEDDEDSFIRKFLSKLKSVTGYGVAVNTSFNLRGEPNVEKPKDAVRTFLRSKLDVLALSNFIVEKTAKTERSTFASIHAPD